MPVRVSPGRGTHFCVSSRSATHQLYAHFWASYLIFQSPCFFKMGTIVVLTSVVTLRTKLISPKHSEQDPADSKYNAADFPTMDTSLRHSIWEFLLGHHGQTGHWLPCSEP